jgi:hypothetical protein
VRFHFGAVDQQHLLNTVLLKNAEPATIAATHVDDRADWTCNCKDRWDDPFRGSVRAGHLVAVWIGYRIRIHVLPHLLRPND